MLTIGRSFTCRGPFSDQEEKLVFPYFCFSEGWQSTNVTLCFSINENETNLAYSFTQNDDVEDDEFEKPHRFQKWIEIVDESTCKINESTLTVN